MLIPLRMVVIDQETEYINMKQNKVLIWNYPNYLRSLESSTMSSLTMSAYQPKFAVTYPKLYFWIVVNYRRCINHFYYLGMCWELMREFLQGFLGSTVPSNPPPYLANRMQENYTPIDTIHQYLEHFMMFRKSTGIRT